MNLSLRNPLIRGATKPPREAVAFNTPVIVPLNSVGNTYAAMRKRVPKQEVAPNLPTHKTTYLRLEVREG